MAVYNHSIVWGPRMRYGYHGEPLRRYGENSHMTWDLPLYPQHQGAMHHGPFFPPKSISQLRSLPQGYFASDRVTVMMSSDIYYGGPLIQGWERPGNRVWYSIDRSLILELLPRTRFGISHLHRHDLLDLDHFLPGDIIQNTPGFILYDAFRFVFGHLEEHSNTGFLNMFELADYLLQTNPDHLNEVIRDWGALMHAICVLLDNERGLGCSTALLRHIMDFLEKLFPRIHNVLGSEPTMVLFHAFIGIFTDSGSEYQKRQIERIWNGFDVVVQAQLFRDMRHAMATDERAHCLYQILTTSG